MNRVGGWLPARDCRLQEHMNVAIELVRAEREGIAMPVGELLLCKAAARCHQRPGWCTRRHCEEDLVHELRRIGSPRRKARLAVIEFVQIETPVIDQDSGHIRETPGRPRDTRARPTHLFSIRKRRGSRLPRRAGRRSASANESATRKPRLVRERRAY